MSWNIQQHAKFGFVFSQTDDTETENETGCVTIRWGPPISLHALNTDGLEVDQLTQPSNRPDLTPPNCYQGLYGINIWAKKVSMTEISTRQHHSSCTDNPAGHASPGTRINTDRIVGMPAEHARRADARVFGALGEPSILPPSPPPQFYLKMWL